MRRAGREFPLLIVVDDAHWADPLSVRWLVHLAARLSEMPVAVVIATRGRDARRPDELAVLGGVDGVDHYRLAPLTLEGTSALVRRSVQSASDELCRACYEASGGNAFLTVELAKEIQRLSAVGTDLNPDAVADLVIDRVDRVVARRLVGAGHDAAMLARAAAICGSQAMPADVAAVAGLAAESAGVAAEALRGAGLLDEAGTQLSFAHPLLRSAVERSIPAGERSRLHRAAAQRLDEQGETANRVGSHLLMVEPGSDPWVRQRLVAAAQATLASGAPGQAVALYQRALAERTGRDPSLLLALGRAAMGTDPAAAEAPLREAMAALGMEERVAVAPDLAVVLQSLRRFKDIVTLLEPLVAELDARGFDRGARLRIEAELLAQSFFDNESRDARAARLEKAAAEIRGDDPEEALILVQLAITSINHGTAQEALDLIDRASDGGSLAGLVGSRVTPAVQWIPYLYMYVDQPQTALDIADQWLAEGRARGSSVLACFSEAIRAEAFRRMGLLVDAMGAAEVAWSIATEIGRDFPGWWIASAAVAQELVASGEPARALEFLDRQALLESPPPEIMLLPCPRVVRAETLTAAGRTEQGVAELLAAWQWIDELDQPSPGAWHFPAVLVDGLLLQGRKEEASGVATRWLARTERFGARSTLGMAQRAVALTLSGQTDRPSGSC